MNMNIFELEITAATQYATAFVNGKPFATVARRKVYDTGKNWRAYALDGSLLFETDLNPTARLKRLAQIKEF